MELTRTTEIRHVDAKHLNQLAQKMTITWKTFMAIIPKRKYFTSAEEVVDTDDFKYTTADINTIENASIKTGKLAAEILFDEWGTSGKIRPTLSHLLKLFIKVNLFRAADFVAVDLLKEDPPERPSSGPAARVNTSLSDILGIEEPGDSIMNGTNSSGGNINGLLSDMAYPRTSELIFKTGPNNNKDCYEKLEKDIKKFNIEKSPTVSKAYSSVDLMKFSTSIENNTLPNFYMLQDSKKLSIVNSPADNVAPAQDLMIFSKNSIMQATANNIPRNSDVGNLGNQLNGLSTDENNTEHLHPAISSLLPTHSTTTFTTSESYTSSLDSDEVQSNFSVKNDAISVKSADLPNIDILQNNRTNTNDIPPNTDNISIETDQDIPCFKLLRD